MRRNNRSAGVLLCAALGVSCSGVPMRGPAAAAAPVARAASTARTDEGAAATRRAPALVNASLVRQGYRVVKRGDQLLYCRSQSVTGTAFLSTVCKTESQIRDQDAAVQQYRDTLNQPHIAPCVTAGCGGG
jgi:hypothetical protein